MSHIFRFRRRPAAGTNNAAPSAAPSLQRDERALEDKETWEEVNAETEVGLSLRQNPLAQLHSNACTNHQQNPADPPVDIIADSDLNLTALPATPITTYEPYHTPFTSKLKSIAEEDEPEEEEAPSTTTRASTAVNNSPRGAPLRFDHPELERNMWQDEEDNNPYGSYDPSDAASGNPALAPSCKC